MFEYIFTIGCFDTFHEGHVALLKTMKEQSEKIIIGLHNTNTKLKTITNNVDSYETRKKNLEMYAHDIFMIDETDPTTSFQEYVRSHFNHNLQPINIGSSKTNTKVLNNDYNGHLFFIHDYKDTFAYQYADNNIIITRTDQNSGWGQNLLGYKQNWCFITTTDNTIFPSMNYIKSIMPVKYLPCATNPQRMKNSEDTQKEIPKIIYICHKNIECLDATYNFWKNLNPLYEIRLFDDALCENFLLEEFSELHQSIFKFIPDGPIKSDFWRVCIIYKYGGIYVDADIHPLVPLKEFLLHDSDFVTCMTKHNQNFNPHFIAARKNDPILKECIEEYIEFYNKRQYEYWKWSIVHVFNRKLSNVKHHYNKTPTSQVFTFDNKKYQLFLEEYDNKKKHFLKIRKTHPHDYYCSFLNERIFNTRYNNYDPCDHSFKNYIVKNRKTFFDILRLR